MLAFGDDRLFTLWMDCATLLNLIITPAISGGGGSKKNTLRTV
jgi:hypothetical protein